MTGTLGILNVGAGDTKLSFDPKNPKEREYAAKVVTDMLKKGYAIMVKVGTRKGQPLYQRATKFDPKTCEYIIFGAPEDEAEQPDKVKTKKNTGRRIKAESTESVAVARTAGG